MQKFCAFRILEVNLHLQSESNDPEDVMLKTWVTKKKPRKLPQAPTTPRITRSRLGMSGPMSRPVRTPVKRQRSSPQPSPSPPPRRRSPQYPTTSPKFNGWTDEEVKRSRRRASFQTPSKKFKGDSRYTGSDNEDDFNDFTMNKGFIQYDL